MYNVVYFFPSANGHWLGTFFSRLGSENFDSNFSQFIHLFFYFFSGNVTEQKCNEVLATTTDYDVTDGSLTDLIVNCKINQEIIPRLLGELKTCKEEFPPYGRLVYSCSCQFIQYVLPTITISVAYYQIYGQLKIRLNQKMRQLEIRCLEITGD